MPCQKQLWSERNLGIPSSKVEARKIRKAKIYSEIIVFHFREKVREDTTIT